MGVCRSFMKISYNYMPFDLCNKRLNQSYTKGQVRLRIFDKDPKIKEINDEASKHLKSLSLLKRGWTYLVLLKRVSKKLVNI